MHTGPTYIVPARCLEPYNETLTDCNRQYKWKPSKLKKNHSFGHTILGFISILMPTLLKIVYCRFSLKVISSAETSSVEHNLAVFKFT